MKEFISAVEEIEAEDSEEESYVEFKVDDRVMHAYKPTDGQLTFLLASMGRGQSSEQRFAAIINIMLSSLREEDAAYLESRLLTRDPKTRLKPAVIESIFEYLVEEWFARPTQPQSDSAPSPQTGGPKSKPRTSKSTS